MIVIFATNKISRVIEGIGIATPAFGPPVITALATVLVDLINPTYCPTQIAYISGTLGTLIGADLLNMNKLSRLNQNIKLPLEEQIINGLIIIL